MRGDKSSKWSLRHGQTSAAFSVIPARGQSFLHWLIEKRVYRDINKDSVYRISIQIINHLANLWPPKLLLFGEVLPSTLAHSFASVALDWLPEFSLGNDTSAVHRSVSHLLSASIILRKSRITTACSCDTADLTTTNVKPSTVFRSRFNGFVFDELIVCQSESNPPGLRRLGSANCNAQLPSRRRTRSVWKHLPTPA